MEKCVCGKMITNDNFQAMDLQKNTVVSFCSKECILGWVRKKTMTMWLSLGIGVILTIIAIIDGWYESALIMVFIPYMIREIYNRISDFGDGIGNEIFLIVIILLGSVTIIYPLYKFVKEYLEYKMLKEKYM